MYLDAGTLTRQSGVAAVISDLPRRPRIAKERAVGIMKKLKTMVGSVSKELMQNGLLGRGQIVEEERTEIAEMLTT